ncbi:CD63 antigen [Nilaparvata lugens]|uniref:CD63 antigen n=1 Tax=Nilaparvata lugens TaxID=108931 RepID=UPI000B98AFE4|nr:CD63 antigen [Nilaparvata lugens]
MLVYSSTRIRYILFIFNLIFVVTGITLLAVGLVIENEYKEYATFLDHRFFSAPSLLVVVGTIIFFIAFFGCCGAIRENHCMVMTFSALMGTVFVMELIAGITGYALCEDTIDVLRGTLNSTMMEYPHDKGYAKIWDELQSSLQCCGSDNYSSWYRVLNNSLPMSCCGPEYGAIHSVTCNHTLPNFYNAPCLDSLGSVIKEHAVTIGASGISIAFVQLLGVVFACRLARSIHVQYESV